MGQVVRVQLIPSNRFINLNVSPNSTIEDIRNILIERYGVQNPEVRLKRGEFVVAIPGDVRVEDLPSDAVLQVSSYTDVGASFLTFEEEARLLKKHGWYKIGDTRLLWPYAMTYNGKPVAIYVKKSPRYPDEEPIIYIIPLGRFRVKNHLRPKPECCFEGAPPVDEVNLISLFLNRRIYVNGICQVHIDRWDGRVGNPLACALNIIEVRFGLRNINYA
ncbi:MAG TPA: hypothetical protein ENG44_03675 [Desulfurococcaceae archaeon]|nr:hypothetical protein [Desulfurococcaceae archaeon]